jgi:hypothetical protein
LGAQLLRYALFDIPPEEPPTSAQAHALAALKRLLELDGFACQSNVSLDGSLVPLLVSREGRRLAVGTRSSLVGDQAHSLKKLEARGLSVEILNDYVLRQNLPDEHQLIRAKLF